LVSVHQQSRVQDLALCKLDAQDVPNLPATVILLEGDMDCNGDAPPERSLLTGTKTFAETMT